MGLPPRLGGWAQPVLPALHRQGIELDQRMRAAWDWCVHFASGEGWLVFDVDFIRALLRQNPTVLPSLLPPSVPKDFLSRVFVPGQGRDQRSAPMGQLLRVLNRALASATVTRTLGTNDFLRALLEDALETGDVIPDRLYFLSELAQALTGDRDTPLSDIPILRAGIERLRGLPDGANDYQYVVTVTEGKLVFRPVSVLGDFVQEGPSNLWVPSRVVLSHFRDHFGGVTPDEIEELEELLNDPSARESQFQRFFEDHPHIFRRWDFREVYPHVYLTREDQGPLIPDFILTNQETQDAAILDLKLPRPGTTIIRRQKNRDRFADAVMAARAQLLEYRDWFDVPGHRERLKHKLKMEIYRPRLMVIIGRSSEFRDALERQKLRDRASDIEVVTYDDIVKYAKQRRIMIAPPGGS